MNYVSSIKVELIENRDDVQYILMFKLTWNALNFILAKMIFCLQHEKNPPEVQVKIGVKPVR